MKKLLKWLFKLLFLLVVLVGLLLLFRHTIVQALLEREIRRATGMEVTMERLEAEMSSPVIRIQNLRLFNPSEFDRGVFADFPEVYLEYDRDALRRRQLRFHFVRLDLYEVHFQRNPEGQSNLQVMADQAKARRADGPSWLDVEFAGIDILRLTLGRLRYTDQRDPSKNDEVWLGVRDATIKPANSLKDLEPFLARLGRERKLTPLLDQLLGPFRQPDPHPALAAPTPERPAVAEPAAR